MRRLIAILASALVAALAVTGSTSAVSDTYGGVAFHPFAMPGDNGCVAWVDATEGTTYNCDPVNLIFPNQTWQKVRDRLRAKSWTTWGLGSTMYLHFATPTRVGQNVQLYRSDGGLKRYHLRLWQSGTTTIGAVHHEMGLFDHSIDRSWDDAEAFVRGQLCGATCSMYALGQQWAMQDGLDGLPDNDLLWRGWLNDAKASVIP